MLASPLAIKEILKNILIVHQFDVAFSLERLLLRAFVLSLKYIHIFFYLVMLSCELKMCKEYFPHNFKFALVIQLTLIAFMQIGLVCMAMH